jgi:hypothetical protein
MSNATAAGPRGLPAGFGVVAKGGAPRFPPRVPAAGAALDERAGGVRAGRHGHSLPAGGQGRGLPGPDCPRRGKFNDVVATASSCDAGRASPICPTATTGCACGPSMPKAWKAGTPPVPSHCAPVRNRPAADQPRRGVSRGRPDPRRPATGCRSPTTAALPSPPTARWTGCSRCRPYGLPGAATPGGSPACAPMASPGPWSDPQTLDIRPAPGPATVEHATTGAAFRLGRPPGQIYDVQLARDEAFQDLSSTSASAKPP